MTVGTLILFFTDLAYFSHATLNKQFLFKKKTHIVFCRLLLSFQEITCAKKLYFLVASFEKQNVINPYIKLPTTLSFFSHISILHQVNN